VLKAGHHRRGLAVIPTEMDCLDAWIDAARVTQGRSGGVFAAVIDEEDFEGSVQSFHHGHQLPDQYRYVGCLVVEGNYY